MTHTSTASAVQDIAVAEADSAQRLAEAKRLCTQELEAYTQETEQHLDEEKTRIKAEENKKLEEEEQSLNVILKEGDTETKKQLKSLQENMSEKHSKIVKELVEQFLTLSI